MTMIIGMKTKTHIYLLGDRASVDTSRYHLMVARTPKIVHRGDLMFGGTGSFGSINDFKFLEYPTEVPEGMDEEEFLHTKVVPVIRKAGSELLMNKHPVYNNSDAKYTVWVAVVKDRLFGVGASGDIYEIGTLKELPNHSITSVGCGRSFVDGVLYSELRRGESDVKALMRSASLMPELQPSGVTGPFDLLIKNILTGKVTFLNNIDENTKMDQYFI